MPHDQTWILVVIGVTAIGALVSAGIVWLKSYLNKKLGKYGFQWGEKDGKE